MCMRHDERLTLGTLLEDPMIRLVMASDGVSEQEMRSLMLRMRRVLSARSTRMETRLAERAR